MPFPQRKPIRLKEYDYSAPGWYFITVCTQNRVCSLSRIVVGEGLAPPAVELTATGKLVETQLREISKRFPSVEVGKYVIMPNHIHLMIHLQNQAGGASPSPTVIQIVGILKSQVTRLCKGKTKLFQRSFYDHIIRNEADYQEIWTYIDQNPAKWREDKFYSES